MAAFLLFVIILGAAFLWVKRTRAARDRWIARLALPGVWQCDAPNGPWILEFAGDPTSGRYIERSGRATERGRWRLTGTRSNWNQRAARAAMSCVCSTMARSASMVRVANGASTCDNAATSCRCASIVDVAGLTRHSCDGLRARDRGAAPCLRHRAPRCVGVRDSCGGPGVFAALCADRIAHRKYPLKPPRILA